MDEEKNVTMQELQQMLIDGEITTEHMVRVLSDNLGEQETLGLLITLMEAAYDKDFLVRAENQERYSDELDS